MFDKFWAYFIESDHSYAKRFLMFCGIVTSILCADYFFRFSDSYITEKKLDQISKIQEILKTDSLRAEPKRELYRLESEILNRQGFWAFSSSCISFLRSTISSQIKYIAKNKKTNPIDNSVKIVENNTRSIYWHIITSCWFLIIYVLANLYWTLVAILPLYCFADTLFYRTSPICTGIG